MTQLDTPEVTHEPDPPTPVVRRRLRRRGVLLLVGALALVLGGAAYGGWALFLRPTTTATTQYRTQTVSRETLRSTVSATGTLNPARSSELSFGSSGEVSSVEVDVGDKVSKGDVLARIDDAELQIDADAAEAELTEARESLDELEDDDSATDTALASARATVEVKKNAVTQADEALDDATLVAPFSGTVAAVGLAKGDTVGSSGTSGSAGSVGTSSSSTSSSSSSASSSSITVISTGTFVVDTSVSNTDLTSIKKGLQATITPTGSEDPVFGTVSSVGVVASTSDASSTSGSSSSGSSTFPVTIAVTGKHTDLLPGSSATVAITTKQLADVISVPTQAVSTVDGTTVVQKLVNGKQVPTTVTIGQVVGTSTVITKGLQEGDEIVVASFTAGTGSGTNRSGNQGYGGAGGFPADGQGAPPNGGTFGGGGTGRGGGTGTGGGTGGTR